MFVYDNILWGYYQYITLCYYILLCDSLYYTRVYSSTSGGYCNMLWGYYSIMQRVPITARCIIMNSMLFTLSSMLEANETYGHADSPYAHSRCRGVQALALRGLGFRYLPHPGGSAWPATWHNDTCGRCRYKQLDIPHPAFIRLYHPS